LAEAHHPSVKRMPTFFQREKKCRNKSSFFDFEMKEKKKKKTRMEKATE
jgi:hypothetical protein